MDRTKKKRPDWDQRNFDTFRAGLPKWRIETDEAQLQKLFKLAELSPTFKQALDWAKDHGIKFFVDQTVTVGGYYMCGTGVVALSKRPALDGGLAGVTILIHEIRHAWQDYYGLIPTWPDAYEVKSGSVPMQSFAQYFTGIALVEADAMAFEKRAESEYTKRITQWVKPVVDREEKVHLAEGFLGWYQNFTRRIFYGDSVSVEYGQKIGAYSGSPLERKREWEVRETARPLSPGIDYAHAEEVRKLGKSFSGKNYMDNISSEVMNRQILSADLAMSFYNAANKDQKKLVSDIRKAYLRLKLSRPA